MNENETIIGFTRAAEFMARENPRIQTAPGYNTMGRWVSAGILQAQRLETEKGRPWAFTKADLIAFVPPKRGWVKGRSRK